MVTVELLLRGMLVGLAVAAPVGPIGILCVQRSLSQGRMCGFVSGLGAATADACYGIVAALGLTVISSVLLDGKMVLQILGGMFLCFMGIKTFTSKPAEKSAAAGREVRWGAFFSTFFLTVTNPMTILFFVSILPGISGNDIEGHSAKMLFVLGVWLGSALWWFILCFSAGTIRKHLREASYVWVNRISGAVVIFFGVQIAFVNNLF